MNDPTDAQSRIQQLRAAGQIDENDANALHEAFPESPAIPSGSREPTAPNESQKFLAGVGTDEELRAEGRRTGTRMGLIFGLLAGLLFAFAMGWGKPLWVQALIGGTTALLAGPLFGWMMFRSLVHPLVERRIALRREAGPITPAEAADAGQCPSCRAEAFDVWSWHKPAILHWVLNPGLAFNELILGQRVPASLKICRECKGQAVDCSDCHRAIDGMTWSGGNAFGHWGGLRCPHCKGRLPTVPNALGAAVRAPFQLLSRTLSLGGTSR